MRFVWRSLLGILLCGTIVYAGISSEDLEDGVLSSSGENIQSLLRSKQLFREDNKKKCDDIDSKCQNGGTCENDLCNCKKGHDGDFCENIPKCTNDLKTTCENAKAVCVYDSAKDDGVCKCNDENFVFKDNACNTKKCDDIDSKCQNGGTCENDLCNCKKGHDGDFCENIPKCTKDLKTTCENAKAVCVYDSAKDDGVCKCNDENFVFKDNACNAQNPDPTTKPGGCSEAKITECKKFNKGCTKTVDNETCDACATGFEEKEGICKGICSKDKIEDCNKWKKGCTKTENSETCDPCTKGLKEKDRICQKCDCGEEATCSFNKEGKKVCTCPGKNKAFYKNKCLDCDCGEATCSFDQDGKEVCTCPEKKAFFNKMCKDCDCGVQDICKVDNEGKKLKCNCESKQKLHDDKCVDTCVSKGKTECEKNFKICEEKDEGYACGACLDNYKEDDGTCRRKCNDKGSKCQNGGTCENELCKCNLGYDGDLCENIPKCTNELKKICANAKAVCVYDSDKKEGVCECNNKNFVFKENSCNTPKWCEKNPCKGGNCTFVDNIGQCQCEDGSFFNYNAGECEKINPCLAEKDCGNNLECDPKDGQCKCVSGFEWDAEKKTCKDIACDNKNLCFGGADCEETGIANTVKCACKGTKFYDGSKCEDGDCFLNKKKCSSCPEGTKQNGDMCEIEDKDKSCKTDCGFGWCIKKDDVDKCVCYKTEFVRENDGKCVLDENACASGVDADGKRCNCTGIYKPSSNKITCERKTCEDADIKAECEDRNAKCVTKWTGDVSHSCECETGYEPNPQPNGKCVRPCEIDVCTGDRTCYLKKEVNKYICECPPSLKYIENSDSCEPDSSGMHVILKGLLVKKEKYLKKKEIDLIKLNKDVIDAMNAIYFTAELKSALLYNHKTDGNSIVCDVWLQFKEKKEGNADRWKFVKAQSSVLPPALVLNEDNWQKNIKAEIMDFCSPEVRTKVCGQHTECQKNQCSCKGKGYREIKSTIRTFPGGFKSVFCEDIDECEESPPKCASNTTCINTAGDYFCKCKRGFKKVEESDLDKKDCTELCSPNPCGSGTCKVEKNSEDCTCNPGYGGSLCNREDENFKRASKNTVVVGAVLGTILGVVIILMVFYIRRQRKNSYSEDFSPPPRMDNAEMVERGRPVRGVNNRGYQN